jgi:hypothetical protein
VYRLCKIPPRYENSLNQTAMNILGFGVLIHIAVCIWVFTTPEIFPTKIKSTTINEKTYYYFSDLSLYDRVFSISGFPLFLLLCISFGCLFICSPIL